MFLLIPDSRCAVQGRQLVPNHESLGMEASLYFRLALRMAREYYCLKSCADICRHVTNGAGGHVAEPRQEEWHSDLTLQRRVSAKADRQMACPDQCGREAGAYHMVHPPWASAREGVMHRSECILNTSWCIVPVSQCCLENTGVTSCAGKSLK